MYSEINNILGSSIQASSSCFLQFCSAIYNFFHFQHLNILLNTSSLTPPASQKFNHKKNKTNFDWRVTSILYNLSIIVIYVGPVQLLSLENMIPQRLLVTTMWQICFHQVCFSLWNHGSQRKGSDALPLTFPFSQSNPKFKII